MPITVQTSVSSSATKWETERKVFQNPRGFKYRYALLYKNGTGFDLIVRKSVDGITWEDNDTLVLKDFVSDIFDGASLWVWEDNVNSQLVVYVVYSDQSGNIWFKKCTIADTSSAMAFGSEISVYSASSSNKAFNPVILKDASGYIWVIFEYASIGKKVTYYETHCKISGNEGSSWSAEQTIHGYEQDSVDEFATAYPFRSGATRQVFCVVVHMSIIGVVRRTGFDLTWDGTTFQVWSQKAITVIDQAIEHLTSLVIDANNKAIVIFPSGVGQYLRCYSTTISTSWTQEQDVSYYGLYGAFSNFALSVDLSVSPNRLHVFYKIHHSTANRWAYIRYKTSSSTTISWSTETAVGDDTAALYYFSSCQMDCQGRMQLIYTVSNTVRFYEYAPSPPSVAQPIGDGLTWIT